MSQCLTFTLAGRSNPGALSAYSFKAISKPFGTDEPFVLTKFFAVLFLSSPLKLIITLAAAVHKTASFAAPYVRFACSKISLLVLFFSGDGNAKSIAICTSCAMLRNRTAASAPSESLKACARRCFLAKLVEKVVSLQK